MTTDGSPVPRATVRIQGIGQGPTPTYIEVTDKDGAFHADVPAGTYFPTAMRPGYQVSTGAAPSVPVYVTDGKTAPTVEIRLARLGSVSGVVVDADGDPVAGVQVGLMRTNYSTGRANLSQAGMATTDDQGQFRVANAQPGRYYLQASLNAPNFLGGFGTEIRGASAQLADLPTFYPSSSDTTNATAINVQTQAITGLRVSMRRGRTYRVQGTFSPVPTGQQRPSVMISVRSIASWPVIATPMS